MSGVLTVPQRNLLLAMYKAHPKRLHHVNEPGFKVPLLDALARLGFVEFSESTNYRLRDPRYHARLTSLGRREAKLLEHFYEEKRGTR